MDIKGLAEQICKKYNSRDPFEIAEGRNIIVLYEPLGSIRGYYSKSLRQAFIHINQAPFADICAPPPQRLNLHMYAPSTRSTGTEQKVHNSNINHKVYLCYAV